MQQPQQPQQRPLPNMKSQGLDSDKNWTYDSTCSSLWIDGYESSITRRSSPTAAISVPVDTENDIPLMDDSDSPRKDNDWNRLQGKTLVPNSPNDAFFTPSELDDSLEKNDGCAVTGDDDKNKKDDNIDKRGNPLACIFVASLSKKVVAKDLTISLHNHFEQWGEIISIKVSMDWMGRPFAFIQYLKIDDAKQAVIQGYGTCLNGRSIRCEPARVNRTLHLISLNSPLIETDILRQLSKFGSVEEVHIVHDQATSSAYVKFCYRDDAIKAYLSLKTPSTLGSWIVEWAPNITCSTENGKFFKSCVFVGNLKSSTSKADLKGRFERYGVINSASVNTRSKSTFGIVYYATPEAAAQAINAENGQNWLGHHLRVAYREVKQQQGKPHRKWRNVNHQMNSEPLASDSHLHHHPDITFAAHTCAHVYNTSQVSQHNEVCYKQHSLPTTDTSTTTTTTTRRDQPVQQGHHNKISFDRVTPQHQSKVTTTDSTAPKPPEVPLLPQDEVWNGSDTDYDSEDPTNTANTDFLQHQQPQQPFYPVAYNGFHSYDSHYMMAYNHYCYTQWTQWTQWAGNSTCMNPNQKDVAYYAFGDYYYYWYSTGKHYYSPHTYNYYNNPSQSAYDTNSSYYQMYPHAGSYYYFTSTPGPVVCMAPCMVSPNPAHPSKTTTSSSSRIIEKTRQPDQEKTGITTKWNHQLKKLQTSTCDMTDDDGQEQEL